MREGYKQTEVGEIPEDWGVRAIGELGEVVRGGSPRPAGDPRYFNGNFIPWLTVASLTTISKNQSYVCSTKSCLTEEGSKKSRVLEKGTLIISNSGATLGVAKILGLRCCANDGIAALLNQRAGDKPFLIQYINTKTKYLHDIVASGNGQPNLNTDLIRQIKVPFPSEYEQKRISQALLDVDELILSLDKLIAKKRDIKTATMQQLLTGKKRLLGFGEGKGYKQTELGEIPEDWNVRPLGELLKIRHGKSQKDVVDPSGDYPILATGGVIGRANMPLYTKPSVLIGRKGTIDKPYYMATPFWSVDTLFYSEVSEKVDAKFLFYKFLFIDWRQYNEASGVPSLSSRTVESIEQAIPSEEGEQVAISRVLSDFDNEIDSLNAQLRKAQQIKKGMMQELLTGRTRLVDVDACEQEKGMQGN